MILTKFVRLLSFFLACLVLASCGIVKEPPPNPNPNPNPKDTHTKAPYQALSAKECPNINTQNIASSKNVVSFSTSLGSITIALDEDKAPITVKNFLRYVNEGFYNNTIFHRVIKGFMIQGGGLDMKANKKPTHEPIENEADNGLKNLKYTIAMARGKNDPDSATAQFFINTDNNQPGFKAPGYAVFGRVTKGCNVVDAIENVATGSLALSSKRHYVMLKGINKYPAGQILQLKDEHVRVERPNFPMTKVIVGQVRTLPIRPTKPLTCPATEASTAADFVKVKLETTKGDIVLELDKGKAPITVTNFLQYVKSGFYDGTIFHRVISDFMIQGGGLDKDLKKKNVKAPIKNESTNCLKNEKYTIAMARTGNPDSATSQFFINTKDNTHLDYQYAQSYGYAVFGKVIEGKGVVDKIKEVKTEPKGGRINVPTKTITITKSSVIE